jgi:hypothetical protein
MNPIMQVFLLLVKQFLVLWTESPAGCDYHIEAQAIDAILLTIKPTSDILRLIRSFSVFGKYWKASEYRNFLLLYSAGILKDLLPKYLEHWMLLVNAMTILLQIKISDRDLETAHLLIMKFTPDRYFVWPRTNNLQYSYLTACC